MRDLSIVIVNWNTRDLLRDCLTSVFGSVEGFALEVFVVDNNSSDGSPEMVTTEFPQVRLIVNSENLGFAAANNQALPLCSGENVLLLNPDTRVREGAFGALLEFLASHADVGAVGPKVVHPRARLRMLSCGYQPTLRTVFNHFLFLSSLFPGWSAFRGINLVMGVHDDIPREVGWLSGVCLLVRKSVIDQVGPLSENWFMYAEDMEWCDRMTRAGWKLYHVPTATVEHVFGASSARNESVSTMWVDSFRSYFVSRTRPSRVKLFLFDVIVMLGMATRAVAYACRGLIAVKDRNIWQTEARKFAMYSFATARLVCSRSQVTMDREGR